MKNLFRVLKNAIMKKDHEKVTSNLLKEYKIKFLVREKQNKRK